MYAVEPTRLESSPWSAIPIMFDHGDSPKIACNSGVAALVLDPIIDGFHMTRVLKDVGISLNLIYTLKP